MVTPDPASAARADRVIDLRDGQIIDSRDQGTWAKEHADEREEGLLAGLREMGF